MKIKHMTILIGSQICTTLVAIAIIKRKIDQIYYRVCNQKGWYYRDSDGKYHYF